MTEEELGKAMRTFEAKHRKLPNRKQRPSLDNVRTVASALRKFKVIDVALSLNVTCGDVSATISKLKNRGEITSDKQGNAMNYYWVDT
jgi:predicted transcriptional regulator|tara:strand:- start:401 stop:664 length:264 start_codon:yes stop_codon:yes gene_type:complete